jgi:23S rRNA pseudouridine1911/1915/1917 synthase
MAFIKCPIVGDTVYGYRKPSLPLNRHFLHAQRISIIIPGKKTQSTFDAKLPAELLKTLDSLR